MFPSAKMARAEVMRRSAAIARPRAPRSAAGMRRALWLARQRREGGEHVPPNIAALSKDHLGGVATAQGDLDRGPVEHQVDLHICSLVSLPSRRRGGPRSVMSVDASLRADVFVSVFSRVQDP